MTAARHAFPDWLAATLASDASEGRGVLPNTILPLRQDSRVVGPARVLWMSRRDLVIADANGVVIWPRERIDELLVRAEARRQQDSARLAGLQGAG